MKDELHAQAQRFIDAAQVEGLNAGDQAWLKSHLDACGECRIYAESLERTVAALRSFQTPVDPALVEATRRRLYVRARELREHESRMRALWMACSLSWVLGVLTAPLLWWGLEWIGQHVGAPRTIWITALVLWWLTPFRAAVSSAAAAGSAARPCS